MRRWRRALAWGAVAALLAAPFVVPRRQPGAPRSPSMAARLLGPVAGLAAGVQWVRVGQALADGRTDLGLARAERALALDPGSTGGWTFVAWHLAFVRASAEREPDPGRRGAWVRAALDLAERGERTARDPALLAQWQGLVLSKLAQDDDPPAWPGGVAGLWRDAADCFERAAALGWSDGAALAASARAREAGRADR